MQSRRSIFYFQILVGFLFVTSLISKGVFSVSTLILLLIAAILLIFEIYLNNYYDKIKYKENKETTINKEVDKNNKKLINTHSIHSEIKKIQLIPWDVPSQVWDPDNNDIKESYDEDELLNAKESLYLSVKSNEGWDLVKVEHIASERKKEVWDKKKYYWKRKFIK
jgi:Ca2+/Na+ antiporter